MKKYRVDDIQTGTACIYEGDSLEDAFEAIKDAAKTLDSSSDDFEDIEDWDLSEDGNRIWCGELNTLEELCNICFPDPYLGKKIKDFYGAIATCNGDPFIVEIDEDAVNLFLALNDDGVTATKLSDEEEFEDAQCMLDLDGEQPKAIYRFGKYNEASWYICFDSDRSK